MSHQPTPRPANPTKPAGTPAATAVEMNEIVLPSHANGLGTMFGGVLMSWIDIAGSIAAMRHSRCLVVTASMDQLDFIAPVRIGQVVTLRAMVNATGRTSMEVGVRVEAENALTGERVHAVSAYMTFVALGPDGRPTAVPKLEATTEVERLRMEEASLRRAARLRTAAARRSLRKEHAARGAQVAGDSGEISGGSEGGGTER